MFVKICGVRDVETALMVASHRPDAIGLNFYAPSIRCVEVPTAAEIVRQLPAGVEAIGVFVNHSLDEVREIARTCGLKTVQLHGDETPEMAASLIQEGLQVIRVLRVNDETVDAIGEQLAAYSSIPLRAVLIDSRVTGAYGGSGQTAPWQAIANVWQPEWPPLIIAGGLTPANVSLAVSVLQPWGVDTAGGVESSPAQKGSGLVQQFVNNARQPITQN